MEDPIAAGRPPHDPTPPADPPRRWRNLEARETSQRRRALVIVGLLALATAATLLVTVGWLRPVERPALVLLVDAASGPSGVAEIPFAEEDRRALADSGLFLPVAGPIPIDRRMASFKADENLGTLVVLVRARAWIDPSKPEIVRFSKDGAPPAPGRSAEGVSLGDLLGSIKANKAARHLVILDILPPPDDPRLGAAPDDVAALVAAEARNAVETRKPGDGTPPLSILVSCDSGQRPLASEALGRSVFGHYVERGLKGDADSSGDGRVTARELAAFVGSHVERWASRVLETRQTPRLYEDEDGDDFPLALVPRRSTLPSALVPAKEVAPYPQWLLEGWRERDTARSAGVDRDAPRVFAQFEAALLLAERGWRGKLDEPRVRSELAGRLERLRDRIGPTRAIPHPRLRSLAQEASFGALPDPEVLKLVREVAAKRAVPTPESKPGEVDAANARLIAEFASTVKVKSDFDLADAVVRVAAEDQAPGRDAIAFLDRLLLARQPRPAYVESLALHRLAGFPASSWSPEGAKMALGWPSGARRPRPGRRLCSAPRRRSTRRTGSATRPNSSWPRPATRRLARSTAGSTRPSRRPTRRRRWPRMWRRPGGSSIARWASCPSRPRCSTSMTSTAPGSPSPIRPEVWPTCWPAPGRSKGWPSGPRRSGSGSPRSTRRPSPVGWRGSPARPQCSARRTSARSRSCSPPRFRSPIRGPRSGRPGSTWNGPWRRPPSPSTPRPVRSKPPGPRSRRRSQRRVANGSRRPSSPWLVPTWPAGPSWSDLSPMKADPPRLATGPAGSSPPGWSRRSSTTRRPTHETPPLRGVRPASALAGPPLCLRRPRPGPLRVLRRGGRRIPRPRRPAHTHARDRGEAPFGESRPRPFRGARPARTPSVGRSRLGDGRGVNSR